MEELRSRQSKYRKVNSEGRKLVNFIEEIGWKENKRWEKRAVEAKEESEVWGIINREKKKRKK